MKSISKEQAEFIRARAKNPYITTTCKQANASKRNRIVALTEDVVRLLDEYDRIQESKVIEKYGWFDETYYDRKTKQKKTKTVFIDTRKK